MTNLTDLARAAHAQNEAQRAAQEASGIEDERQAAPRHGAEFAANVLGTVAEELAFEWASPDNADDLAAEAKLPGSPGFYLRYVYAALAGVERLLLVRPCGHCGHVAVDQVHSLAQLGDLLTN